MKWTCLAGLGLAATAYADAVTGNITPDGNAPEGCSSSYDGNFEVTIGRLNKRAIEKRSCNNPDALLLTLSNGVLKDAKGRTGYIASNYQFQFDAPPQAGAIYTAGFSACSNGSLALGSSTVFYQCLSGSFYNLYDHNWAAQCEPVEIVVLSCNGGGNGGGQNTVGTTIVQTTIVTAISDGQPQVHTTTVAVPMCQIGDGQVQVHTTPCGSVPAQASPVTQLSEGQPQAPTSSAGAPPVTQISEGQPQAPTVSAKPSGPRVTQASSGTGAVPSGPTSTHHVPINGAPKAPPGFTAALAVALAGVIAL